MTDYPRDKNGKLYENRKHPRAKSTLMNHVKNWAKESVRKQSRDSTDKLTTKWVNSPFDPIPENEVRMLVQQIREWVNRKVAVKALWLWETRAEYFIERGLKYTDKTTDAGMIIEKPTFVKNEILKAEAEQEKIARLALMQSMKKGNAKVALEFLNRQQEEVQQYFNDREEYRQIAQDMGLSKQEYYRCLNVLNGMSEAKASENVWRSKELRQYHYRMNPQVKEYLKVIKIQRRQELMDGIDFTKETAQAAMTYALGILMDEFQKNDNTKQDKINIAKEIRNTAESIGKATNLYPKDDLPNVANIAILASENTDKVLEMIGNKHNTKALNITQFVNGETTGQTDTGGTWPVEDTMQNEPA